MQLGEFLTELRKEREAGSIIPGFLGSGGIGLVGVNLHESCFRPIPDAGGKPFRWPFSGIAAMVARRKRLFFLAHQGAIAAEAFGLSAEDAEAFALAEGMFLEHDPALRRRILKGYGIAEPNPKQVLKCYLPEEWRGPVFDPSRVEGLPLITGAGVHEPSMWA